MSQRQRGRELPQTFQIISESDDPVHKVFTGFFQKTGENSSRYVFNRVRELDGSEHTGSPVVVYYWDEGVNSSFTGWWIGREVGGLDVWAFNSDTQALSPPETSWCIPYNAPVTDAVKFIYPAAKSKKRPNSAGSVEPGKRRNSGRLEDGEFVCAPKETSSNGNASDSRRQEGIAKLHRLNNEIGHRLEQVQYEIGTRMQEDLNQLIKNAPEDVNEELASFEEFLERLNEKSAEVVNLRNDIKQSTMDYYVFNKETERFLFKPPSGESGQQGPRAVFGVQLHQIEQGPLARMRTQAEQQVRTCQTKLSRQVEEHMHPLLEEGIVRLQGRVDQIILGMPSKYLVDAHSEEDPTIEELEVLQTYLTEQETQFKAEADAMCAEQTEREGRLNLGWATLGGQNFYRSTDFHELKIRFDGELKRLTGFRERLDKLSKMYEDKRREAFESQKRVVLDSVIDCLQQKGTSILQIYEKYGGSQAGFLKLLKLANPSILGKKSEQKLNYESLLADGATQLTLEDFNLIFRRFGQVQADQLLVTTPEGGPAFFVNKGDIIELIGESWEEDRFVYQNCRKMEVHLEELGEDSRGLDGLLHHLRDFEDKPNPPPSPPPSSAGFTFLQRFNKMVTAEESSVIAETVSHRPSEFLDLSNVRFETSGFSDCESLEPLNRTGRICLTYLGDAGKSETKYVQRISSLQVLRENLPIFKHGYLLSKFSEIDKTLHTKRIPLTKFKGLADHVATLTCGDQIEAQVASLTNRVAFLEAKTRAIQRLHFSRQIQGLLTSQSMNLEDLFNFLAECNQVSKVTLIEYLKPKLAQLASDGQSPDKYLENVIWRAGHGKDVQPSLSYSEFMSLCGIFLVTTKSILMHNQESIKSSNTVSLRKLQPGEELLCLGEVQNHVEDGIPVSRLLVRSLQDRLEGWVSTCSGNTRFVSDALLPMVTSVTEQLTLYETSALDRVESSDIRQGDYLELLESDYVDKDGQTLLVYKVVKDQITGWTPYSNLNRWVHSELSNEPL